MKALFNDLNAVTFTTDDSEERLLLKGLLEKASVGVVPPKLPKLSILTSQILGGSVTGLTVGIAPEVAQQSLPIAAGAVTVTNNVAVIPDTVWIENLKEGDIVKVYTNSTLTSVIAIGTVVPGKTELNLIVGDLGAAEGSIFITRTGIGEAESTALRVDFSAEA
jgi:hypothetical protein